MGIHSPIGGTGFRAWLLSVDVNAHKEEKEGGGQRLLLTLTPGQKEDRDSSLPCCSS